MWNDPTAGTGFTIYGDYSRPNSNAGGGTAFGGRVALGAGIFTLTGGVASWDPDLVSQRLLSVGGTVGFRLIGGSLIPVAVNLQLGGGHSFEVTSSTTTSPLQTMLHAAVGLSVPLPTPVVSIEPFVSRSEEHTSELQSRLHLVCRLLLEKKKKKHTIAIRNKERINKPFILVLRRTHVEIYPDTMNAHEAMRLIAMLTYVETAGSCTGLL